MKPGSLEAFVETDPDAIEIEDGNEELFYSESQLRDPHGRWTTGGSAERAWTGGPVSLREREKLDPYETGRVGEHVAMEFLKGEGLPEVRAMNIEDPSFAVDVSARNDVFEVKCGLASNVTSSQQWKVAPGIHPDEKEYMATLGPDELRAHNAQKIDEAVARKEAVRADIERATGEEVRAWTLGLILNPKTGTADVYKIPGFHRLVTWRAAEEHYVKTVRYTPPPKQDPARYVPPRMNVGAEGGERFGADSPDIKARAWAAIRTDLDAKAYAWGNAVLDGLGLPPKYPPYGPGLWPSDVPDAAKFYSEDQARDEKGKWTKGSGEALDDISRGAKEAAVREAGRARRMNRYENEAKISAKLDSINNGFVFGEHLKNDPDLELVLDRGAPVSMEGRVIQLGEPQECHRNAAILFAAGEVDGIGTGYAYQVFGGGLGFWYSHSWGLRGDKIIETTVPFKAYFGINVKGRDAMRFVKAQASKVGLKAFTAYAKAVVTDRATIHTKKQEE